MPMYQIRPTQLELKKANDAAKQIQEALEYLFATREGYLQTIQTQQSTQARCPLGRPALRKQQLTRGRWEN
jgi:hypothetical protein